MRCSLMSRRLSASVALAALLSFCPFLYAQALLPGSFTDAGPAPAGPEIPQAIQIVHGAPPTPEERGDALMLRQRYQAAIEAYRESSQDSATVWNKMGIANQMMFNLQEASRCYHASLSIDPNNPHVFNNLGTVYESQKRYGDAERMYRRAIRLAPGSALAFKNLGTVLLVKHEFKKGWDAYQTALSLNPQVFGDRTSPKVADPGTAQDRGAMNYYMARGCVRAGMNDCAIDCLRRALNEGFANEKKIADDAEFAGLRDNPAFRQLLAEQKLQ